MRAAISGIKICPVNEDAMSRLEAIERNSSNASNAIPDITVHSELSTVEKAWRRLEDDQAASLHQSFDWCRAWVETQNPEIAVVVGKVGNKAAFILPLEIVRGRTGRIARFIASPYSNINTGLFSASFAAAATPEGMQAAARAIVKALGGHADLVRLTNVPAVWRGRVSPLVLLDSIANQNSAFQLPLLGNFEETLSQINAKRKRKKFRATERKLEALGGYDHVVARSPAEKSALLAEFFRQKAVRFHAQGLPNVFGDRKVQAFFETLAASSTNGATYRLRLHGIRMRNGRWAAVAGLSRKGDHIICQFISVDEEAAPEASPGEFLFHLMIEEADRDGAALFDFGIGDQLYKRNWCPLTTEHRDILLPITLRGRLAALSFAAATRLKSAIKRNRLLYQGIQKMRAGHGAPPAAEQ